MLQYVKMSNVIESKEYFELVAWCLKKQVYVSICGSFRLQNQVVLWLNLLIRESDICLYFMVFSRLLRHCQALTFFKTVDDYARAIRQLDVLELVSLRSDVLCLIITKSDIQNKKITTGSAATGETHLPVRWVNLNFILISWL